MSNSNDSKDLEQNGSANQEELLDTNSSETSNVPNEAQLLIEAQEATEKAKKEYLYLLAEFENFKRNTIKERVDLRKYGSERLAVDLLNVLDIFETALNTQLSPENLTDFKKGIELTATELKSALQRHGIEEVPASGVAFDPNFHEALTSEESDTTPDGHVLRVFKKPYKLHDRVIRHGQVVVAKSKS